MLITLTSISGPEPGKFLQLRTGQAALVGRGEDLEFSFPEDLQMSTRHFQIEGRPDCGLLTDLNSTNGTYVNGERVNEVIVANGDEIIAGLTTFVVASGAAAKEAAAKPAEPKAALRVSFDALAAEVCAGMQLTDDAKPLLSVEQTAAQLVYELRKNSLYADALRVLSRAMGIHAALLWSCGCTEDAKKDSLSDAERQAVEAAAKWASKPSEESAVAAYAAAAKLGNEGPAAMLAMAAYWGAGNMSAPGQPPVPVDQQLPSQAISGALTLVAVSGTPEDAAEKYEEFIRRALEASER